MKRGLNKTFEVKLKTTFSQYHNHNNIFYFDQSPIFSRYPANSIRHEKFNKKFISQLNLRILSSIGNFTSIQGNNEYIYK